MCVFVHHVDARRFRAAARSSQPDASLARIAAVKSDMDYQAELALARHYLTSSRLGMMGNALHSDWDSGRQSVRSPENGRRTCPCPNCCPHPTFDGPTFDGSAARRSEAMP